ncbi:hypothetical protein Poli38472_008491 [Pythium oligandrum]|uniref:Glutaredoxin domain-containing protein n=1 Tax=Pythium oligandrum TaxID=41045 RepID=A0A8K1FEG4_PYTOL|nr:hypothetical protein Poli38472_008491 [Pythium oligandrum]|eukprot:TMW55843.1 hypothetical protein Poli38472_008491 [Pythium oligandrum]
MFTRRVLTAASRCALKVRNAVVAPTGVRAVHVEANTSSIQAAIQSEKVLVFSKTHCPYCARVKALFEDLEVNHEVVELDERSDGAQIQALLLELTKQRTVPNVFINGKHIGGCDSVMELHGKKELEPLLK